MRDPRINPAADSQFTDNLLTAWTMRNRAVLFQPLSDNGVQCICSVKDKCHLLCLALISKYRCSDTVAEIFIAHVVIFRWLFPKYILCPSLPMGIKQLISGFDGIITILKLF